MRRIVFAIVLILSFSFSTSPATKYAGEFLYLGLGARALGMGGAFVAVCDDPSASYWNPAGLSTLTHREITVMHAETFGELLNLDYAAVVLPGQEAVVGLYLMRLGGGGIKITALQDPTKTISESNRVLLLREEGHADYTLNLSYGKKMSPKVDGGINAKVIYRDIPQTSAYGLGMDIGFLYKPKEFLALGANLQDATFTFLSYSTGSKETISPTLKLGAALRQSWLAFSATLAMDSDLRFENRKGASQYWLGRVSLDNHYGLEIGFEKTLFGRLGFNQGDFTAGAGIILKNFGLDLAYLSQDQLDNSYRISLRAKW